VWWRLILVSCFDGGCCGDCFGKVDVYLVGELVVDDLDVYILDIVKNFVLLGVLLFIRLV